VFTVQSQNNDSDLTEIFMTFLVLSAKFWDNALIRPLSLHSKSFSNHHSSVSQPFDTMYVHRSLDSESIVKQPMKKKII
jgi:hypothetical protein